VSFRFQDKAPAGYRHPDANPYLKIHRSYGPPVLTATQAQGWAGRWEACFGVARPLHVEIGTGNGFFFAGMADRHRDRNWLGIEIRFKRVVLTARKLQGLSAAEHARIARYDAHVVDELFADGEIAGLYVNHPDPWDKERWAKNRLLGPAWLDAILPKLAAGAQVRVKTDHDVNVDALLAAVAHRPLDLIGLTRDVEAEGTPWGDDDVETNYQRKFREKGEPVKAVWVEKPR